MRKFNDEMRKWVVTFPDGRVKEFKDSEMSDSLNNRFIDIGAKIEEVILKQPEPTATSTPIPTYKKYLTYTDIEKKIKILTPIVKEQLKKDLVESTYILTQEINNVDALPIYIKNRKGKALGSAFGFSGYIILYAESFRQYFVANLWAPDDAWNLKWIDQTIAQVIYHELLHMLFYTGGHRNPMFRYFESKNPYRIIKSRRLTCIS